MIGFTILALCTDFSWQCLIICMAVYEILKIGCLLVFGIRKDSFVKNLLYSMFTNLIIFIMISFLYLLRYIC